SGAGEASWPRQYYMTRRCVARWRLQRETGRGNRSTGERLSRPLEGPTPARRGLHLLSPLFGSDTAPAPVASLRLLVIRRARSSPSRCASSVIRERWATRLIRRPAPSILSR